MEFARECAQKLANKGLVDSVIVVPGLVEEYVNKTTENRKCLVTFEDQLSLLIDALKGGACNHEMIKSAIISIFITLKSWMSDLAENGNLDNATAHEYVANEFNKLLAKKLD